MPNRNQRPSPDSNDGIPAEDSDHSEGDDETTTESDNNYEEEQNGRRQVGDERMTEPRLASSLYEQKRSMRVQHTISDDRSRGSEFDRTGQILSALKQHHESEKLSTIPTAVLDMSQWGNATYNVKASSDFTDRKLPVPARSGRFREASSGGSKSEQSQNDLTSNAFINQNLALGNVLHQIAVALNIKDKSGLTIETLETYLSDLKAKEKMQAQRVQLVHRVFKENGDSGTKVHMYLDSPLWLEGETSSREDLAGNLPLRSVSSYLTKHSEVCCIVYRDYDITSIDEDPQGEDHDTQVGPKHVAETIEPVTATLATAIAKFLDHHSFNIDDDITTESVGLIAPYVAFYHARGDALKTFVENLKGLEQAQFQVLIDYIASQYENEYNCVDDMIHKGKITQVYIEYLIKPGDIIVQSKDGDSRGYLCQSWLEENNPRIRNDSRKTSKKRQKAKDPNKNKTTYSIKAWSWGFDGQFSRKESTISMEFDYRDYSEKNISNLSTRPLRYVDEPTKTRLKTRGEWLWKCRSRRIVSYDGTPQGLPYSSDERYMIDMMMYRELHESDLSKMNLAKRLVDLEPEAMKQEHPPDENFIYLAPPTVKAYNLKRKKWVDLSLDSLREVSWNTRSFESLVLDPKTKRLIQALISNQIETEKSTDLISGKGNGLIMLLHGGPGTGKTLTAESVAEIAKKPLFPVTCGDIGTKPKDVEEYLESVLYLGKTWGCVVLLDEADVFLEQRSLEDLHRNALVSVFLRVLEYYEGILILTSNRVGTFDEAFRSRIQLAVHYSSLTLYQRGKIWENFIHRLRELNEDGIDFDDLESKVEQLASEKMNGREIRNAITTARQWARWERQQAPGFKLNYTVMKDVIETAGKFDQYINTLNGGLTQEQLANEEGLR